MIQRIILLFVVLTSIAINAYSQADTSKLAKEIESSKVKIKYQRKADDLVSDSIYQWRISQSHLDDVYIPLDITDCFKQLDKLMEEPAKKRFMDFSDEEVDRKTHLSLGKWIDHKWQISEGSRISNYFKRMGVPHPDYMVGIIITSYHRYLHKRDLKLKEQVAFFKAKWDEKQKKKALEMLGN